MKRRAQKTYGIKIRRNLFFKKAYVDPIFDNNNEPLNIKNKGTQVVATAKRIVN